MSKPLDRLTGLVLGVGEKVCAEGKGKGGQGGRIITFSRPPDRQGSPDGIPEAGAGGDWGVPQHKCRKLIERNTLIRRSQMSWTFFPENFHLIFRVIAGPQTAPCLRLKQREATGECGKRLSKRLATIGKAVGDQEAAVTKPLLPRLELE